MELKIHIDDIDYGTLAATLLPLLPEGTDPGLGGFLLGGVRKQPALVKGLVDAMPREKKEELVSSLVNRNSEKLSRKLTDLSAAKGVPIHISRIEVET